jgi:hypothetical protein
VIVVTVFATAALGGINRLVHGGDDVGHGNIGRDTGQGVAAARAAYAVYQFGTAQFAEQLFQIGKEMLGAR